MVIAHRWLQAAISVKQGAAGHAARLRTAIYSESFSSHPELKLFAIDNLKQFRDTLRTLRRQASRQPMPAQGFKLDAWDGEYPQT